MEKQICWFIERGDFMAERYRFFDSVDGEDERSYTADEFAEYFRQLLSSGIFNGGTNLQVTTTGSDMNISIQEGYAWLEGYLYKIDTEPLILTLDAADASLNRVDRIVIRLDKSLERRYVKAFVLKGIPAEVPTVPALTRNENIYEISLAQVNIVAGKSFISEADVIDERFNPDVCGIVNSLVKADVSHIISTLENEWQEWFDGIQSGTYTLQKDFEPVRSSTRGLTREVANLKLYQEATQRIENGIVFGDNFIGDSMGIEFNAESSTTTRIQDYGVTFKKTEALSLAFSLISDSGDNTTWRTWGQVLADPGATGTYDDVQIQSELFDVTDIDKIEIDGYFREYESGSTSSYALIDMKLNNESGETLLSTYFPTNYNETTTKIFNTADINEPVYLYLRARAKYYGHAEITINAIRLIDFGYNEETTTYNLNNIGNEAVVFVTKEGDFDIEGYLNGNLMEKEIHDGEYQFYKSLTEDTPLTFELVSQVELPSEANRITRIIGGISK